MRTIGKLTEGLDNIAEEARKLEYAGADIASSFELNHDPLIQLALAATSTEKIKLMTCITVAFARSPMTLAQAAHDVNSLSKGRLILGIGSQIKPHIEKRYDMPWSKPAARMREYIMALKAIWSCWYDDTPLDFRGEFYNHTLMTPMFSPSDTQYGAPPVFAAAVGALMTEKAAEVADGILLHAFTTEEYVRTVTMPAIESGLAKAGRDRRSLQIVAVPFFVTGETEEQYNQVKAAVCKQIAFYGSTPAYRGVLESVGYGELQDELHRLSKQGKWQAMGDLIDNTLLNKIALVGDPGQIAAKLSERYGELVDICSVSVSVSNGGGAAGYNKAIGEAIQKVTR